MIPAYSSPAQLGHRETAALFDSPVIVQEKVDGSQASVRVTEDGTLEVRSRGEGINLTQPPKMFGPLVATAEALKPALSVGHIYRGEFLSKPRHNCLAYSRVPAKFFMLFDVQRPDGTYMSSAELKAEAERLGLETVPVLFEGTIPAGDRAGFLRGLMARESALGGAQCEGVVVKNYINLTPDGHPIRAKVVSEAFKEKMDGPRGPAQAKEPIVDVLVAQYRTEARFQKALQHLNEAGKIVGSMKDVGPLIKEVGVDVFKDVAEEIKEQLFREFWPQIQKQIIAGVPEWYKKRLAESLDAPAAEVKVE